MQRRTEGRRINEARLEGKRRKRGGKEVSNENRKEAQAGNKVNTNKKQKEAASVFCTRPDGNDPDIWRDGMNNQKSHFYVQFHGQLITSQGFIGNRAAWKQTKQNNPKTHVNDEKDWKMLRINKGQKRRRERENKFYLEVNNQTQQKKSAAETREEMINTSQEGIQQFGVRKGRENTGKDDSKEGNKAIIDKFEEIRIEYLLHSGHLYEIR